MKLSAATTSYVMQSKLALQTPNYWIAQTIVVPQTVIFLSFVDVFQRPEFLVHALVAPVLMAMWNTAVWTGVSVVRDDRWESRLELHAAAPIPYAISAGARILAVVSLSMTAIPTAVLTAWITFGVPLEVASPVTFAAAVGVTAFAIAGAGTILAALSVLSRAAVTFQSSVSYPILLLGGVFVPLALLPAWTHPIGRFVFLSWSSDLLRASVLSPNVASPIPRLAVVMALGTASWVAGVCLIEAVFNRIRENGEVAFA